METELRRISRWWNVNQSAAERLGPRNEIEVKIPRARDTWLFKPSCMMNGLVQGGEQEILDSEHGGGPPTLSVLHSSSGHRGISLPFTLFSSFSYFLFYYYYYYYFFLFVFSLSRIALTIDLSLNYCPLFMLDNKNDFSCVRVIVDPRYSSIFLFFFFCLIEIFWCSSFLHLFKRKIAFKKNLWINWFVHGKK